MQKKNYGIGNHFVKQKKWERERIYFNHINPSSYLLLLQDTSPLHPLPNFMSLFCFFIAHWVHLVLPFYARVRDQTLEHGRPASITLLKEINSPSPSSHEQPRASHLGWGLMSPSPIAVWTLIGLILSRSWMDSWPQLLWICECNSHMFRYDFMAFVPNLWSLQPFCPLFWEVPWLLGEGVWYGHTFRAEHSFAPYSLHSWTFYLYLKLSILWIPFCKLKASWPMSVREISTFPSHLTIRVPGSQMHTTCKQSYYMNQRLDSGYQFYRVIFLLSSAHFIVDFSLWSLVEVMLTQGALDDMKMDRPYSDHCSK